MGWLMGKFPGLLHAAMDALADVAMSLLESDETRYRDAVSDLDRLKFAIERIDSHLIDADEDRRRLYVDGCTADLWPLLRSLSFDADDLLDLYCTALGVYRQQRSFKATAWSRKRKWYQIDFSSIATDFGPRQKRRLSSEVDQINKRLKDISTAVKALEAPRLRGEVGVKLQRPCWRGLTHRIFPHHNQAVFVGREHEKDEIVKLLTSDLRSAADSGLKVPVIPIHGMAGIGKTALAQMIYNDDRIKEYFSIKVWVGFTSGCHVRSAMKEIYEQITGESCAFEAVDALQNRLREHLQTPQGHRFLLVIENLCIDDCYYLETVLTTLLAVTEGSKVLITTPDERVCQMVHALSRPNLASLNDNEWWQLFECFSLPQAIDIIDRERFVNFGKEIAKRCHGSPLAAKILGTLLRGATEEVWSDVLLEMRDLKHDQNRMLAILKISYRHLSYPLKQCFAYCSIFPYGYKFERDQVVRYWMAEGLIRQGRWQQPQAVGKEYFDELVWRSFFEKIPVHVKNQVERYTMPRLTHDLARLVSDYEFRSLESDFVPGQFEAEHHNQPRYASLLHRENKPPVKLECIERYPKLRTLKVCDERGERVVPINPIREQSLRNCVHLRVLDLSNSNLVLVPDSIAELIHLRYLGLSNTEIRTLPEKMCVLFKLQTLDLKGCLKLEELPKGMHKLVNLRHLDLHLDWEGITDSTDIVIPPGIRELRQIQTLARFTVTYNAEAQDCNLVELKDLELSGELCILNIERVPVHKPEAALDANLRNKSLLKHLMLRWNGSSHSAHVQWEHSKMVMQHLKPNDGLQSLWVINYPGTRFPNWIGNTAFSSLETIRISNCNNFTFLPLLGQLPVLKNLQIDNIPEKTMDIVAGFPSLEYFSFCNLRFLERACLKNVFPKLVKVCISDCPDLKELVINQNLLNKFKRARCPNLSVIIDVP